METIDKITYGFFLIITSLLLLPSFVIDRNWESKCFYKSGNIKQVINYKGSKKHGKAFVFNDNKNSIVIREAEFNNGEKVGEWKQFDENGNIICSTQY